MSIVTKQGDKGKTRLYSGEIISKSSGRLHAYGTLDELVSFLGLARGLETDAKVASDILWGQRLLSRLGTELATKDRSKVRLDPIIKDDVCEIEGLINDYESKVPPTREFITPGANTTSATLHICRTICRRLERLLVSLSEDKEWHNSDALILINRLSDLLFLMARAEEESSEATHRGGTHG